MGYRIVGLRGVEDIPNNVLTSKYGSQLFTAAANNVMNTPEVKSVLSYPAFAQAVVTNTAITDQLQTLNTDVKQILNMTDLPQVLSEALDQVIVEVKQVGLDALSAVLGADSAAAIANLASSTASGVVTDVADMVPVLGTIVSLIQQGAAAGLWGNGGKGTYACNDPNTWATACVDAFLQPSGTGPQGQVMPTDLFNGGVNGKGFVIPPVLDNYGYLKYVDPVPGLSLMSDIGWAFFLAMEPWPGCSGGGNDFIIAMNDSQVTIPPATRLVIRDLRRAIQSAWKTLDGGATLWPIYIDLVTQQIDKGRVPNEYIQVALNHFFSCTDSCQWSVSGSWDGSRNIGAAALTQNCYPFVGQQVLNQFGAYLQNWRIASGQRPSPTSPYVQFQNQPPVKMLTEAQLVQAAKQALQRSKIQAILNISSKMAPKQTATKLALPSAGVLQAIQNANKSKGPLVVGAAALAAALWFFL